MKTILLRVVAALAVAMIFAGCANVKQETAMEWLQRQPLIMDP